MITNNLKLPPIQGNRPFASISTANNARQQPVHPPKYSTPNTLRPKIPQIENLRPAHPAPKKNNPPRILPILSENPENRWPVINDVSKQALSPNTRYSHLTASFSCSSKDLVPPENLLELEQMDAEQTSANMRLLSRMPPLRKAAKQMQGPYREGHRSFTPNSHPIAEIANTSYTSKKMLEEAIKRIEEKAHTWIAKEAPGWEHREFCLQYLYTQFQQHLVSPHYPLPETFQQLANAILTRAHPLRKVQKSSKAGAYGQTSYFEIGPIRLAVKTATHERAQKALEDECDVYVSLTPRQREGVIDFFGCGNAQMQRPHNTNSPAPKELILKEAIHGNWSHRKYKQGTSIDYITFKKDIISILKSLHNFHSGNQVHIDFKPDNVLVDENALVLCDLGSVVEGGQEINKQIIATALYHPCDGFPPEDSDLEKFGPYTPKSDVWSLGISIYNKLLELYNDDKKNRHFYCDLLSENKEINQFAIIYKLGLEKFKTKATQDKIYGLVDELCANLPKDQRYIKEILQGSLQVDCAKRLSAEELLNVIAKAP